MPTITIHRTRFTDVQDGEYVNPDTDTEVIDCTPDVDDETAVDLAVRVLLDEGLTERSSSGFHVNLWYCLPDGSKIVNYATDEREEVSAHLDGFSDDEQKEIYERIVKMRKW